MEETPGKLGAARLGVQRAHALVPWVPHPTSPDPHTSLDTLQAPSFRVSMQIYRRAMGDWPLVISKRELNLQLVSSPGVGSEGLGPKVLTF